MELDNSEEIKQKILALPSKDKPKAAALHYYLKKKREVDDQMDVENKQLQAKFDKLSLPLYEEISNIVRGSKGVKDFDLSNAKAFLSEEEINSIETKEIQFKPIKDYWLQVLLNAKLDELQINDRDQEALKSLNNIEIIWEENMTDFTLKFYFDDNLFFKNTCLEKKFLHDKDQEVVKGVGTQIEWRDNKNLTKKIVKKKQRNKKTGQERVITKEVDGESFFLFFRSIDISDEEKMKKMPDNEAIDLQEALDVDYDLGRLLIDEIIPYSIEYFLGVNDDGKHDQQDENDAKKDDDEDFSDEDDEDSKKKAKKTKKGK